MSNAPGTCASSSQPLSAIRVTRSSRPMGGDVARRPGQRVGREVDADAVGVRIFLERGDEQAARAGAEVEDRQRSGAIGIGARDFFDQCLRVGARDQHAGADGEVETPEFLVAGDVGERLAQRPAGDEVDSKKKGFPPCPVLPPARRLSVRRLAYVAGNSSRASSARKIVADCAAGFQARAAAAADRVTLINFRIPWRRGGRPGRLAPARRRSRRGRRPR